MLFNSAIFLFGFLPCTLLLYFLIGRLRSPRPALFFLVAASLFFYGWWLPKFLLVIVTSILGNAVCGYVLIGGQRSKVTRRVVLILGIVFNISLLGYFKYAFFVATNLNYLLGTHLQVATLALPLGISFFTFQNIAFQIDAYRGLIRRFRPLDYVLFVTFFPQLIAGPIVHHSEYIPQIEKSGIAKPDQFNLAMGLSIFCIGLFMKVVLADVSATFSDPVFNAADAGRAPTPAQAWVAVLAYSFQLYFDFAGYSAMAIGLARMFNVILPLNFYSPYKAVNIIDFWRRWHITLSRFLRDYLYFPLGGNRRGPVRRYVNLLATMILGGLWHGAAWTFVLWGTAHGLMLVINHVWHAVLRRIGIKPGGWGVFGRWVARAITFTAVTTAWVPFRSGSFDGMRSMLAAMYGGGDPVIASLRTYFSTEYQRVISGDLESATLWLICVGVITFGAPNLYQLFGRYRPALMEAGAQEHFSHGSSRIEWRMSGAWALLVGVLLVVSLTQVGRLSPFLYFQF